MKLFVMSVRDRGTDAFGNPFFAVALGQATRGFADEVNRKQDGNMLNLHPEDFDLYHLGSFDTENAKFECLESPRMVAVGKDMYVKVNGGF